MHRSTYTEQWMTLVLATVDSISVVLNAARVQEVHQALPTELDSGHWLHTLWGLAPNDSMTSHRLVLDCTPPLNLHINGKLRFIDADAAKMKPLPPLLLRVGERIGADALLPMNEHFAFVLNVDALGHVMRAWQPSSPNPVR